jgi:hypothetical protein
MKEHFDFPKRLNSSSDCLIVEKLMPSKNGCSKISDIFEAPSLFVLSLFKSFDIRSLAV